MCGDVYGQCHLLGPLRNMPRSDHLKLKHAVCHSSDIQTAQEHKGDSNMNPSRASVPTACEPISSLPLRLIVFVMNSLCRNISLVNNTAD